MAPRAGLGAVLVGVRDGGVQRWVGLRHQTLSNPLRAAEALAVKTQAKQLCSREPAWSCGRWRAVPHMQRILGMEFPCAVYHQLHVHACSMPCAPCSAGRLGP